MGPLIAILALGLLAAAIVRAMVLPGYVLLGDLDQYARWTHHLATDLPFGAAFHQDFSYMPVLVGVFGALAGVVPAFATAGDAADVGVRIALKVPALLGELAIVAGLYTVLRIFLLFFFLLFFSSFSLLFLFTFSSFFSISTPSTFPSSYFLLFFIPLPSLSLLLFPLSFYYYLTSFSLPLFSFLLLLYLSLFFSSLHSIFLPYHRRSGAHLLPFIPYDGIADYLRNLDYYQNGNTRS